MPIVDETLSRKNAAKKIYEIRNRKEHSLHTKRILNKHGSRKSKTNSKALINSKQLDLF